MVFDNLNSRIESSDFYKFLIRHKKVINIIQGIIIIGLLISINIFVLKDREIKQQISEKCGYTNDKYKCVCEKNYVDEWEQINMLGIFEPVEK